MPTFLSALDRLWRLAKVSDLPGEEGRVRGNQERSLFLIAARKFIFLQPSNEEALSGLRAQSGFIRTV
jgi:hypothetical protein